MDVVPSFFSFSIQYLGYLENCTHGQHMYLMLLIFIFIIKSFDQ